MWDTVKVCSMTLLLPIIILFLLLTKVHHTTHLVLAIECLEHFSEIPTRCPAYQGKYYTTRIAAINILMALWLL